MNNKELCLKLVNAETESEVISLLREAGYWNDHDHWSIYGNNENNFSTIGNQASKPETAVVEKLINCVDAILMSECLQKGIPPDSDKAPQSIRTALITYFDIKDGYLSNLPTKKRNELSERICLVATGGKQNPCYSIIDTGEGQTPETLPSTLLSLGKSNKLRIPFVQGKFNMGGTGVLQFCGKNNLQLIISKRNPNIANTNNDGSFSKWGFTVVRREDPMHGVRSSIYRYLTPSGKILTIDDKELPLLPREYPEAYSRGLEWGTFIKLYEYHMTGLKTNIMFDLYNRLSLLMPTIALPVRLYERRKGYSGHTMETTLSGLSVRLDEDRRDNVEEGFPTSVTLSAAGQKMKALIYAFKKGQSEKYTKEEGILFAINGQTHGDIPKSFFSRHSVGMGYLQDSILVIVDCSDIDGRSREDLFMNSRDRLRSGELKGEIEDTLEALIKNHPGLRQLREKRRREEIEDKLGDSRPLAEIITDIMKKSPTLSKLFISGFRLQNPFKVEDSAPQTAYHGKKFPSVFELTEEYPPEDPKNCPINTRFRVQFLTDTVNDYFDRDSDPGTFNLMANGVEIKDYTLNLWNGIANLTISLPENAAVGADISFECRVTDITRIDPLVNSFHVVVQKSVKSQHRPTKPPTRKPPPSDNKGKGAQKQSNLDLPEICEVRRENWEHHSFDEQSVLKVVDNGDLGYDFFINMDNIHLRTEQKANTQIDSKLLDARYKYGMALIGMAFLQNLKQSEIEPSEESEDIQKKILDVTKIISPVLLPMIDSLGDLDIGKLEGGSTNGD